MLMLSVGKPTRYVEGLHWYLDPGTRTFLQRITFEVLLADKLQTEEQTKRHLPFELQRKSQSLHLHVF